MEGLPVPRHVPRVIEIEEIRTETPTVKSFLFKDELCSGAVPGQFAMIWIPGVDEVPMSVSHTIGGRYCGVSAKAVGQATNALHALKKGDKLGVRGPYGNGFTLSQGDKILIVGGGTGVACLAPLIELLASGRRQLSIVLGARTASELVFLDRIERASSKGEARLLVTTDDGSSGLRGFAAEHALKLLQSDTFDQVYTCGPELMMAPLIEACTERGTPVQASLERYMKCGIGLCGSCVIGPYRVCKEGPVFNGEQLKELREFGRSKRDISGSRERL